MGKSRPMAGNRIATWVDAVPFYMNTELSQLPDAIFETGQGGSFLTFDLGLERIAFSYLSLTKAVFCRGDRITLEFAEMQVDILGKELVELFRLLTHAKIEVVRQGCYAQSTVSEIRLVE